MLPIRRSLLLLGLAVVLGSAWLAPLDSSASHYAEAGLKRALVSFATARTLNAVISVVQGTQTITDRKIYPRQAAARRMIWPFSLSPVPD